MDVTREAVEFFKKHAGLSYNPATETPEEGRDRCARLYAQAEAWAKDTGHEFVWSDDWAIGSHVEEFDCYDDEPGTCEFVTMLDRDENVVQAMGCVDDATDEYRRVVEAELAYEAMPAWTQPPLPIDVAS